MKEKSDVFKVNLIYFIIMVVFVVIRILSALNVFETSTELSDYAFSFIIQIGIMFLLPLILYTSLKKQKGKQTFKEFGFKKVSLRSIMIALGLGVCVYFLNIGISTLFSYILSLFGYVPSTGSSVDATWGFFFLSLLFTAILPGFCEEFTHRGMLKKGYESLGARKMIVYSSLLFGLMHMNVGQFFYATVIGVILCLIAISSDSIVPAMIVHFMNNAINVYLSFAKAKGLPFGKVFENISVFYSNSNPIISIMIGVLFFCLVGFLAFLLIKSLFKDTYKKKFEDVKRKAVIETLRNDLLPEEQKKELIYNDQPGLVYNEMITLEGESRFMRIKVPFEDLGIQIVPKRKPTRWENFFFYSSVVLGSIVTIFTYIWGVIA